MEALTKRSALTGDIWGGLAAMLVALPSAIAFGVTIYAPLGGSYAAQGAIAGILGATTLGLVAATFGGTKRLISAPCAPAAAVLAGLAIQLSAEGSSAESIVVMLTLVGLICGLIQLAFGAVGLGRLIKYMPFPVVSGYLTGVGIIIIASQVPKLLGVPAQTHLWESLVSPALWQWQGIAVGAATVAAMLAAPLATKAVPAVILGLVAGILAYFGLAFTDPAMLTLEGNALVVGPLGGGDGVGGGAGFGAAIADRWHAVEQADFSLIGKLLVPALTLAVLLSIDTLKTCVVLDALTRSRHDSNRELIGQGLGNLASTVVGGLPGAGQMGATLVNMSSGAQTRRSGMIEGALAFVAFLVLGTLIAWIPIACLAGILIVIGARMIDRSSLHLLESRATLLDFAVIATVVLVALSLSLIAASAAGIVLAVALFIREQIRGSILRHKAYGNEMFSKRVRLPAEMAVLEKRGASTAIFELQGSLFFGTTDQLYTTLEAELKTHDYLILDMRRVQSVDLSAVHMLEQIQATLAERDAYLIFSQLPENVPSGQDMRAYFAEVGLVKAEHRVKTFEELDEALEWVEERLIEREHLDGAAEKPLQLREIDLFLGRRESTLAALEACTQKRSCKAGQQIFASGDVGDEIFLIRSGAVRIVLPLAGGQHHHLATFGRGDFFGEMAFLDQAPRSADAVAYTDTDLYVLSRKRFDTLAEEHKKLALSLVLGVARNLAIRLRYTNAELRALSQS